MTALSQETQTMWATLKQVGTDTLERKRRLGEYAVVWQDNKPVIIGERLDGSENDFRLETSLTTNP